MKVLMKRKIEPGLFHVVIIAIFLILISSCKKDIPNLQTPTPILDIYGHIATYDIDGNQYHWLPIGQQAWMIENLKVTKYRNGYPIPNVTVDTTWNHLTTGAYCNYNNNKGNVNPYGNLYNWYAINDSRNVCPTGWHVATLTEWTTLRNYLGGALLAGGKMKEVGFGHWTSPNTGATNMSYFTALPGGYFCFDFLDMGLGAYWWTSTEWNSTEAYNWALEYSSTVASWNSQWKNCGFSVRCIKD